MARITILYFLFILLLSSCGQQDQKKAAPTAQSSHGTAFNQAFDAMLADYDALTEAMVIWDSAGIPSLAEKLHGSLTSVSLEEMHKDSAGYALAQKEQQEALRQLADLRSAASLENRRREFDSLSRDLFALLDAVAYDKKKIYLQQCPMAFNDTETAAWLTDKGKDSIRNPYLGTKHPKYGDGMLECGENKMILDHQK